MSSHETCPYRTVPGFQRWDRAFAATAPEPLDPYEGQTPRFQFNAQNSIVTAGSCFAQNIAKRLRRLDYGYVTAEYDPALSAEDNDARNNTMFSARYGNIYTVAHLVQLMERAYGRWQPQEEYWEVAGRFYDSYRPSVDPAGFASLEDLRHARNLHLAAVRRAFESCDVFIFTLGLTEGWINKADAAAYPICPGCGFGTFDPQKYEFKNYTLAEITAGLERAIALLLEVNPKVKIILTVSPVPLAATMEPRHVLLSTAYSKSVLRIACEEAVRKFPAADYFASFEIVNWGRQMSSYFEGDLRSVSEDGIDHVMRVFFRHYAGEVIGAESFDVGGKAWCDDDLLLEGSLNGPVRVEGARAPRKYKDADEEYAEQLAQCREGFTAKKFEATVQRSPHPYTTWKGVPGSKALFGRILDNNGFYNSRNIADFMGPEFRRVCVIGPSLVMDLENEEPDTICGLMQRELNARGYEHVFVYNCGIHASVTGMDASNLLHYVTDFYPDVVVALSGGNDLRAPTSGDPRPGYPQSFFLWERILKSFRVEGTPPDVTAYLEDFQYDQAALRRAVGWNTKKWLRDISENYQKLLYKMRAMGHGFDFGFLAVNPPTRGSHRNRTAEASKKMPTFHLDSLSRSEFFRTELPCLHDPNNFFSSDMAELVDDLEEAEVFNDFVHMKPVGYERIARKIVDELIQAFPDRIVQPPP